MICARHHYIAWKREHGQTFCLRCFTEALRFADAVETDRIIKAVRARIRSDFR